jgi:hypothetical protein
MKAETAYPSWFYYPSSERPPAWVHEFISVVAHARSQIDSAKVAGLKSNTVPAGLQPGLVELGYTVEVGPGKEKRIRRPVLFGENGRERVAYHVDAVHDELGVLVEVEAGRGARGNAVYRDLIRSSLIVDARFLVLGVMLEYHHMTQKRRVAVQSYREAKDQLDALFASGRLTLPFKGVLLFGY